MRPVLVGQRFVSLLEQHPVSIGRTGCLSPFGRKTYREAVGARWAMAEPMPEQAAEMVVLDASDVDSVVQKVDFIFCAVDMKKDEIRALEERYARAECPVVSNNSAHRGTPDVPMVIPEINDAHLDVIASQRARLVPGAVLSRLNQTARCKAMCRRSILWMADLAYQRRLSALIRRFPARQDI